MKFAHSRTSCFPCHSWPSLSALPPAPLQPHHSATVACPNSSWTNSSRHTASPECLPARRGRRQGADRELALVVLCSAVVGPESEWDTVIALAERACGGRAITALI